MHLYKLTLTEARYEYDLTTQVVVMAPNEISARALAYGHARNEDTAQHWLNPVLSTCDLVSLDEAGVILAHFRHG